MPSFTPYQTSNQYPAGDASFRVAETFGPVPRGHDYLDDLRMNWRRTPNAEYPDGYLGTLNTRRGDRLLEGLKDRGAGLLLARRVQPVVGARGPGCRQAVLSARPR